MSGEFPVPDVLHFDRRCHDCGDRVRVECAFGADPPPREPYYRCPDCRPTAPEPTPDRLALIDRERTQLRLVRDDDAE